MARSSEPTHERPRAQPRHIGSASHSTPVEEHDEMQSNDAGPIGRSYDSDTDWRTLGVLGAGIALGMALGAGVALLTAARTGADTRDLIGERARLTRDRVTDRWGDLRDEFGYLTHRGRRKMHRQATRGRWTAEDVLDRGRKRMW